MINHKNLMENSLWWMRSNPMNKWKTDKSIERVTRNNHFGGWSKVQPPPPSRAKIESSYEKETNAFSNTIYLKIIWRVSTSRIEYLRHTEPFAKINSVSFFMCFGRFDSLFHKNLRSWLGKGGGMNFGSPCMLFIEWDRGTLFYLIKFSRIYRKWRHNSRKIEYFTGTSTQNMYICIRNTCANFGVFSTNCLILSPISYTLVRTSQMYWIRDSIYLIECISFMSNTLMRFSSRTSMEISYLVKFGS